jgi:hypothetical protein
MFESKQTAIEAFIQQHANMAGLQLVFENMKSPSAEVYDEWLRFTIQFGDSRRMQIGSGGYRHPGMIMAQIFTKEGVGINRGVELADLVNSMLRDQVISGVNVWVPKVIKVPVADAGWHQVQVAAPFYFDEVI